MLMKYLHVRLPLRMSNRDNGVCSLKSLVKSVMLNQSRLELASGCERCWSRFGRGRWRKLKGFGRVRLPDGTVRGAELHWFEAHGIGRKKMRIKRFLD